MALLTRLDDTFRSGPSAPGRLMKKRRTTESCVGSAISLKERRSRKKKGNVYIKKSKESTLSSSSLYLSRSFALLQHDFLWSWGLFFFFFVIVQRFFEWEGAKKKWDDVHTRAFIERERKKLPSRPYRIPKFKVGFFLCCSYTSFTFRFTGISPAVRPFIIASSCRARWCWWPCVIAYTRTT